MNAALRTLDDARRQGLRLSINGSMLHVEPVPSPETIERLRAAKPQLMAQLKIEALTAEACAGLDNVKPADILTTLTTEDLADVQAMADPLPFLRSFACALSATRWRQIGVAPPGWTHAAHCDRCGPVYLWRSVKVAGCPWCWNRLHGVKIPRPPVPGRLK